MLRSYSRNNLIQKELEALPKGKGNFFERLSYRLYRSIKVKYELEIPSSVFLRAITFCGDLSEWYEEDFTPAELMLALYKGFIARVQRENDIQMIYTQYMVRLQEQTYIQPRKKESYIDLEIYLHHDIALRGEMALADMDIHFPNHPFTLEKVLEIDFMFFIEECQKGSKTHRQLMRDIIACLDEE